LGPGGSIGESKYNSDDQSRNAENPKKLWVKVKQLIKKEKPDSFAQNVIMEFKKIKEE
jgi:hypothetical protein